MQHTVSIYRALPYRGATPGIREARSVLLGVHQFEGPAVVWGAQPSGDLDGVKKLALREAARLWPGEPVVSASFTSAGVVITLRGSA